MKNELLQKVKDDYAASQISNGVEFNNWAEFIDFHSGEPISWFETHVNAIAEAYHAKQSQKHHLVEPMKMDEGKDGEPCFTKEMLADDLGCHVTDKELAYFNARSNQYATDRAKKALEKAAENAKVEKVGNSGSWMDAGVKKSSITDPKNLEV